MHRKHIIVMCYIKHFMEVTMEPSKRDQLNAKVVKLMLAKEREISIVTPDEYRRKIGKFAEALGITLQEAFEYTEPILRELFEEMLDQSKFSK